MADTGWVIAGQGRNVSRGDTDWVTPENITADDATNATNALTSGESDWLVADTFDLSSIPSDATITGIEARIQASGAESFESVFGQVNIGKDDSTLGTAKDGDEDIDALLQTTTPTNYAFGGRLDMWGLSLSIAEVQATTFQVRCWFDDLSKDAGAEVRVDAVWVRVHYTRARDTVILITTTGDGQTWTVPNDWNSLNNTIEVIGAGAGGSGGQGGKGGAGGGGGAYAMISDIAFVPGASVSYRVGSGGAGGAGNVDTATGGGDTWFDGTSVASSSVGAKGGSRGTAGPGDVTNGGAGGLASSSVGDTTENGGSGGDGYEKGSNSAGGGGGGGAGGPNGDGADGGGNNGVDNDCGAGGGGADGGFDGSEAGGSESSSTGGSGGANRQGLGVPTSGSSPNGEDGAGGRGGDIASNNKGTGSMETLWVQTSDSAEAGPGSGAGGGSHASAGGTASRYGGGGGGGGCSGGGTGLTGGSGRQGIIVISYYSNAAKTRSYIVG